MTQEEFLLDTLEYYSADTSRRCLGHGRCYYSPKGLATTGNGCAIGRWLPESLKESMDTAYDGNSLPVRLLFDSKEYSNFLSAFPDMLKLLSPVFLSAVQRLHDSDDNWSENGISDEGKKSAANLVKMFELDASKFHKYIN